MWNSSILPIDATTLGQSGPGYDGNEEVLSIPEISSITEASPLVCFVLYQEHTLGESYPSTEKQSVYSEVSADGATSRGHEWKQTHFSKIVKTYRVSKTWSQHVSLPLPILLMLTLRRSVEYLLLGITLSSTLYRNGSIS